MEICIDTSKNRWSKRKEIAENIADRTDIRNRAIARDEGDTRNLIKQCQDNDSLMGKAFRDHARVLLRAHQTPDDLRNLIQLGERVIITTDAASRGRQAIQLELAKKGPYKGEFVAVSEPGKPIINLGQGDYHTIAITVDDHAIRREKQKQQIIKLVKEVPKDLLRELTSKYSSTYIDYRKKS